MVGDARKLLEQLRWPNGPVCPHCGVVNDAVTLAREKHDAKTREGLWWCRSCERQFSVTVGSVMEGSHIPLGKWMAAIHMLCSSKKSISALQVQRQLELGSYRTAWHLCHRIRHMMANDPSPPKLEGIVEADEVYIGGKPRRHRPHQGYPRTSGGKKTQVAVLVQRDGGPARARPMPYGLTSAGLKRFIRANVDRKNAALHTDEAKHYNPVGRTFADGHEAVNHSIYEYARGDVHNNTAESFNGLFKRCVQGAWHHISAEHLSRYLDEQCFRWSNKDVADWPRTKRAIAQAGGIRLYYKEPRTTSRHSGGESLVVGA